MANQPKRKDPQPNAWQEAFEKDFLVKEPGPLAKLKDAIRAIWLKALFGHRRKHPRQPLEFSDPLQARLLVGKEMVDVAPSDIGQGGMGLEVPHRFFSGFAPGNVISLQLSFDGKEWQEVSAEIRHARSFNALRGYMGVQFKNPSPELLKAIVQYNRTKPGKI